MGKRGLFPTFRKALSTKLSEKLSMEILAKFTGCEKRLAEERGRKNRVNRAKITKLSDVHSEKITNKTIRDHLPKKKMFSFGHCPNEGGGPCPN